MNRSSSFSWIKRFIGCSTTCIMIPKVPMSGEERHNPSRFRTSRRSRRTMLAGKGFIPTFTLSSPPSWIKQEMPRFADGLMLLGVTLSEKREEVEAISIYDEAIAAYEPAGTAWANAELALKQAEDAFNKSAAQTKEEQEKARSALERAKKVRKDALQKYVPAQKMVQQAQLFKATALRKLFRWQDSHRALSTLQALEGKVDGLLALPDLGELDRKDLSKIRLGALIEKSYILGQYLNLLNPPNFASALAGNETPEAVKPSDDVRDKVRALTPGHEGDPAYVSLRNTLFLAALSIIYDRHLRAVETAEQQAKQLYGNEPLNWTRESDNYVYQLHQTKGDGLYRRAQTAAKDDNEFKGTSNNVGSRRDGN